jgi:hypothetical protein
MTRLRNWEEITGTLEDASEISRGVEVSIDGTSIILDDNPEESLLQAIGSEVSILRTDDDYRIRVEGDK